MRAMVVYESMFGNARQLAGLVAEQLAERMSVEVFEVGCAPDHVPDDVDLLVLGAPTHTFGLSRPQTREEAKAKAPELEVPNGDGMREWLDGLHEVPAGATAIVFYTAIDGPSWVRLLGSAGRGLTTRARKLGLRLLAPAERFFVKDVKGPLLEGELQRAKDWVVRATAGLRQVA